MVKIYHHIFNGKIYLDRNDNFIPIEHEIKLEELYNQKFCFDTQNRLVDHVDSNCPGGSTEKSAVYKILNELNDVQNKDELRFKTNGTIKIIYNSRITNNYIKSKEKNVFPDYISDVNEYTLDYSDEMKNHYGQYYNDYHGSSICNNSITDSLNIHSI